MKADRDAQIQSLIATCRAERAWAYTLNPARVMPLIEAYEEQQDRLDLLVRALEEMTTERDDSRAQWAFEDHAVERGR